VNPVLILSYNGLPMLKKCVESVRKQTIDTRVWVVDNASSDGSQEWLKDGADYIWQMTENTGVSKGWNLGLSHLFGYFGADHVLVTNQDLVLPNYFYAELLAFDVPFVTGFPVQTEFEISPLAGKPQIGLSPYPCFSAFLIRRSCWEKVGPFDERFFAWAGDCDYHVRGHRLGVGMFKSGVPFYHEAGSTARNASPEEKEWFHQRANADREVFRSLYGCIPGEEPAYTNLFQNLE
jgi:GT2 family glycosyltransferase